MRNSMIIFGWPPTVVVSGFSKEKCGMNFDIYCACMTFKKRSTIYYLRPQKGHQKE